MPTTSDEKATMRTPEPSPSSSGVGELSVRRSGREHIPIAGAGGLTRPLKASESVARRIVKDIASQGLALGNGLPSESEMIVHYETSRETVREALRLLEAQGLISIRRGPGGGPQVSTVDPGYLGRVSTLYYQLAGATYRELFEAWVESEGFLAERAARNPDAALRRQRMSPYFGADRCGSDTDLEVFVNENSDFHAAVASLVKNRVLELSYQTMGRIFAHHTVVSADPRLLHPLLEEGHAAVARGVASGHPLRSRRLMEEHVGSVCDFYGNSMGAQMDDYIEWK